MGKQRRAIQRAKGHHIAQANNASNSIVNTTNINLDHDTLKPNSYRALHQLPAPVLDFVGRAAQIEQIVAAFSPAAAHGVTVLVWGMGGVGKTQLAYAAAQRLANTFPDAQLHINLHGADQRLLTPEQALQRVVQAFEPEAQPADDPDGLATSYRSLLKGKRALIIADDAHDAAQVRALAPPPGSALLITSRNHFVLPGITVVALDMLPDAEAAALLLDICPRIGAAAAELAQLCGRLPLALRVSASLLAVDTTQDVATYLESLREIRTRLARLCDPDDSQLDVEASLNLSYTALSAEAQSALRQLSIFPTSFDLPAAKEVVSLDVGTAKHQNERRDMVLIAEAQSTLSAETLSVLRQLSIIPANGDLAATIEVVIVKTAISGPTDQPVLQEDQPLARRPRGRVVPSSLEQVLSILHRRSLLVYDEATERYTLHDLVRDFASARLMLNTVEIKRLDRYARHYLHVAQLCNALYLLGGEQMLQGLALFDRERVHIDAGWGWVQSQANATQLIDYAVALSTIDELRYHARHEVIPRTEAALQAARHLHRRREEGVLLNDLGNAYRNVGQPQRAIDYHQQALKMARATHDRGGESAALGNLGNAYMVQGGARQAIIFHEQHLAMARELGDHRGEGSALGSLGIAYAMLGDARQAIDFYEQALEIGRELGDHRGESAALNRLGLSYADLGDVRQAITFHEQHLAIAREIGDRGGEGSALGNLGRAYLDLGELERAIALCEQSLTLHQEIGNRCLEAYAHNYLALACAAAGQHQRAQTLQDQALTLSRAVEDPRLEAQILIDTGKIQLGQGDIATAIEHFAQALSRAEERGYQIEAARASWNLGLAYERQGDQARALLFLQARVDYERTIGHARADEHAAYLAQVQSQLPATSAAELPASAAPDQPTVAT